MNLYIEKAHVKAHSRKTKGKIVLVAAYDDKRTRVILPDVTIKPFKKDTKSYVIFEAINSGKFSKQEIIDYLNKSFPGNNKQSLDMFILDFQKPIGTYSGSRGLKIVEVNSKLTIPDGQTPAVKSGTPAPQPKAKGTPAPDPTPVPAPTPVPPLQIFKVANPVKKAQARPWIEVEDSAEATTQLNTSFNSYMTFIGYSDSTVDKAIDSANAIGREVTSLYNKFENIRETIFNNSNTTRFGVGLEDKRYLSSKGLSNTCNGLYQSAAQYITIATEGYRLREPMSLGGWNACKGILGAFRHELGHHFYYATLKHLWKDRATGEVNNKYSSNATSMLMLWEELFQTMGKNTWTRQVSGYAATSSTEAWAECFAAYTDKDYGKETLKFVINWHGTVYGGPPNFPTQAELAKFADGINRDRVKAGGFPLAYTVATYTNPAQHLPLIIEDFMKSILGDYK
jgi:hypothetical protein